MDIKETLQNILELLIAVPPHSRSENDRQAIKLIEALLDNLDTGNISDGYHTFDDLYNQRLILTAALCNCMPDKWYKSKKHSDGEDCFGGGWFIVGCDTAKGQYSYHYELKDFNLFKCKELPEAPEWDGHTSKDVERLLALGED